MGALKPHHQSPPPGGRETGWWEMSPHNVTLNPTATIPTSRAQLHEQPPSGPHLVRNSDYLHTTDDRRAVVTSMVVPVPLPVCYPQGQGWVGLLKYTRKWQNSDPDRGSPHEQSNKKSSLLLPGSRALRACLEQARRQGAPFMGLPPSRLRYYLLLRYYQRRMLSRYCSARTALDHRLPAKRGSYCP